jgi:hypothetical protein
MKFQIDFNDPDYQNDNLLIKLGAKLVPTGSQKYPPFEIFEIEIDNIDKIKDILDTVDKELHAISSAVISFDSPTLFIDFIEKKMY